MTSRRERNRLAAQAWAAQTEKEFNDRQSQNVYKELLEDPKPSGCRYDLELHKALLNNQVKYLEYISRLFSALAAIGILLGLQALALGYLIVRGM